MKVHKNTYITELITADGRRWAGPDIEADSFEAAEKYIEESGMGYLTVVGELKFSYNTYELN